MEQRTLGKSGLRVSAMGLGLMSMSGTYGKSDDEQSIRVIHAALDRARAFLDLLGSPTTLSKGKTRGLVDEEVRFDRGRIRRLIEKSRTRERTLDRIIRGQAWLDPVAEVVQKGVGGFYVALGNPGRALKNAMHGTTVFGHPLHPAMTDVPKPNL